MKTNLSLFSSDLDLRKEFSLKTILELFFLVIAVILFLRIFVLDFNQISSESMEPVLLKGDIILVSRLSYFFGIPHLLPIINQILDIDLKINYNSPKINDIIVFAQEKNSENRLLVKRVAGIGGDTVLFDINTKKIRLNNDYPLESELKEIIPYSKTEILLNELNTEFYFPYINSENRNTALQNGKIYIDNKIISNYKFNYDYYFLMGDNKENSIDSREFGLISEKYIIAKPLLIIFTSKNSVANTHRNFQLIK